MYTSAENTEKWLKLNLKVKENAIVEIFKLFRMNGIEPILIKGRSVAEFYPRKYDRQSIDIDICIASECFQNAKKILINTDLLYGSVDLHNGLRNLDTLDWETLFENSISLQLNDYFVRTLCPEDQLRVICIHWLIDGGECKQRLIDIYWLVTNRPDNFDWAKCLEVVPEHRRRWITCVIGIAHKYLGLEIDDLPFADEAKRIPGWLIKTIEKEWASKIRIIPLHSTVKNPKILIQQLVKRFPPNPISATVLTEGSFDSRTRVFYQIKNFVDRLIPSIKKIGNNIQGDK